MSDNVKAFTKEKRLTPDEYVIPIFHECIEDHRSMKWLIQIRNHRFNAVCTDCSESFPLEEMIEHLLKESEE